MPYRKRYRKRSRRRKYNKRRSYIKRYMRRRFSMPRTLISKTATGIPDRQMMKLKYTDFLTLDPAGTLENYLYRGNSLFDPDLTGGGHQPLGRDQWVNFYSRYRVRASKIRVSFLPRSNTTIDSNIMIHVIPTLDAGSVSQQPRDLVEQPYSRWRLLGTANGTQNGVNLHNYMSTKKIMGIPDINTDDYASLMTTNPLRQWYWNLGVQNLQSTVGIPGANVCVQITYYVELFDRVSLSES